MAQHRTKLPAISEEMKAWSAALGAEIADWPNVTTKPFFGFTALYLRDKLFGLLPRTRAMGTANSLVFKFETPAPQVLARLRVDSRVGSTVMKKACWYTCSRSPLTVICAMLWTGWCVDRRRRVNAGNLLRTANSGV